MAVINVGVYESINGWTGGWSGARTWTSQKIDDQSTFQNKVSRSSQDTLTVSDLATNRAQFQSRTGESVAALEQGLGRSLLRSARWESESLLSAPLASIFSLANRSEGLLILDTRGGYGGYSGLRPEILSATDAALGKSRLNARHDALLQGLDQSAGITTFYAQRSDEVLTQETSSRLRSALMALGEPLVLTEERGGVAASSALRLDVLSGSDSVIGQSRLNASHQAVLSSTDRALGILMFYAQRPELSPLQEVSSRSVRMYDGLTESMTLADRLTGVRVSWGRDTALMTLQDAVSARALFTANDRETLSALDASRAWASMTASTVSLLSLNAVEWGQQSATGSRLDTMSLNAVLGGIRAVNAADVLALTLQESRSGQARFRADQRIVLNLAESTGARARFYALNNEPLTVSELIKFIDLLTDGSGRLVAAFDITPRAIVGASTDRLFTNEAADRAFAIDQTIERTFQS